MRRILVAVAAALAAAFRYTWVLCCDTGQWVLRAVASVGAAPAMPIMQPEPETVAPTAPAVDPHIEVLQRVAQDLNAQRAPSDVDWRELSDLEQDWLEVMSLRSRLVVGSVNPAALIEHMKGKRTLARVLAFDRESVDAYVAAVERDDLLARRSVEHAREAGEDPDRAMEEALGW